MKKQYIFLILLAIILYILYRIVSFTYQEHKMNSDIEFITQLNQEIKEKNRQAIEIIEYKKSKAYKNYILKSEQSFKNKGEKVVYLTTEQKYNKFTKEHLTPTQIESPDMQTHSIIDSMTIYQKWVYFIFQTDIR